MCELALKYIEGSLDEMTEQDYKLIRSEVKARRLKHWNREDEEDFVQDVVVKLLQTKTEYITKGYIRKLIYQMQLDQSRKDKRRPHVLYSSSLADSLLEKGRNNGNEE